MVEMTHFVNVLIWPKIGRALDMTRWDRDETLVAYVSRPRRRGRDHNPGDEDKIFIKKEICISWKDIKRRS